MVLTLDTIYNEDCLIGMKDIPDRSVDMILCDLPYGTTRNKWDTVIPLDALWEQYRRILKGGGTVALSCQLPFLIDLANSNRKWLRYEWIWHKTYCTGFLNANRAPMKTHENILIFYESLGKYNPQGTVEGRKQPTGGSSNNYGKYRVGYKGPENYGEDIHLRASPNNYLDFYDGVYSGTKNYPRDVITFGREGGGHPTQKPVSLFEYLIRTYTDEGDTVLDNCMGTGTTAVACIRSGRHYIGYETDPDYCERAERRIAETRRVYDNNLDRWF